MNIVVLFVGSRPCHISLNLQCELTIVALIFDTRLLQ